MNVLGISALYHDASAALVVNGEIIAAAQEERFTRKKHDMSIPVNAINFCLSEAGIQKEDIDIVVYYDNPLYTLDRYIKNIIANKEDCLDTIERSFESLFSKKIWIHRIINNILGESNHRKILVCEHHLSHGASAFYPSPFQKAVILTLDGVGEWATTTIGVGNNEEIVIKEGIQFPHSLGLLYSAFTYYCGFKVNSGDYKFMGLAPYGEPVYEKRIRDNLIDIKEDGSFRLNLDYFDFQYGRAMTNSNFDKLFGGPKREPETEITKREMDIAASAQRVVEDVIFKIVVHAKMEYGKEIDNLVLAGGVALNCVANGKIKNSNIFKNIWIQPAAGDAGGSLGAALYASYQYAGVKRIIRTPDSQKGSYLGNYFKQNDIVKYLDDAGYKYHIFTEEYLYKHIAEQIACGKVIGLFQGRMEFGPRALGNRSIIADARSDDMQIILNKKIKFRESFRPFAPSVLRDKVADFFELESGSPYMLLVANVAEKRRKTTLLQEDLKKHNYNMLEIVKQRRSDIPAVTHVDYSARIQTVTKDTNPYFYKVLSEFEKITGYGVLVNTSFNVRGEPIVCTLQNAYECFMRTDIDILVLENCILYKEEQPKWEETYDWRNTYELD